MRHRADFTSAVRTGRRAAGAAVVVHMVRRPDSETPARFGLIISRSVGGSVVRHRVARRLRAVLAERLGAVVPGDLVVVRALPAAARATSSELATDLDRALNRLGCQTAAAGVPS